MTTTFLCHRHRACFTRRALHAGELPPIIHKLLRTCVALLLFLTTAALHAASANFAFYYGASPPWDELQAFDVVVVEPAHGFDPRLHSSARSELFAYVSVGEVASSRPYAQDLPSAWTPAINELWNTRVIDQTQPEWPRFLVDRIIAPLWAAGYRGFFLDNLDSFHLLAPSDEQRVRQVRGLIEAVRAIRAAYPDARLIFNRGFEILPELHDDAYAVAAESLLHGWDPKTGEYSAVSQQDRDWLLERLQRVREEYKLPVIAIEYTPTGARDLARETARKLSAMGFIPWVSNADLDQLGIGAIEVMPRKILVLYEGDGNELTLYRERVHQRATLPLNYLGYTAEYVDVNRPLPAYPLVGRYAGIVSWFASEHAGHEQGLREWLDRQREQGMRFAMLGAFPFALGDAYARRFGIVAGTLRQPAQTVTIDERDPLIGFEAQPIPDHRFFIPIRAADATTPLLQLRTESGDTMDAAALMPWGGYVLSPYDSITLPAKAGDRWLVDPFQFMRRALALPDMPVPDVTTENGRRLMFVHVDGDRFADRAELPGNPFAGEVLLREVLQRYRIPHTVSIIQGETGATGAYPKIAPQLERIARRIFALPHVELASHSYSHPVRWSSSSRDSNPRTYHVAIPGYDFDLNTEIAGSVNYINSRLAPATKRVRLMLWTGDNNPGRDALEVAQRAGVLNLNGGGAWMSRQERHLSTVLPVGIRKGTQYQVYAASDNENAYTNNWTGPFYGYERSIETFELTDAPYRLKPINIYYNVFSATKRASLRALHQVYDWALAQPVMNIYASEYALKVLDFNRIAIARSADGWLIRGSGAARELRVPARLGVPDVAASRNVAGYVRHGDDHYVHLTDGEARLQFAASATGQPYVEDANGTIGYWRYDGTTTEFNLRSYVSLRFSLANVGRCHVVGDGHALTGISRGAVNRYELKQNGIERISITCAG